jgi:hypothetical protein
MAHKKIVIVVFILFFTITGCGIFSSKTECEKIIERREMVSLLTDVFLLEAQAGSVQTTLEIRDSLQYYYSGVFHKHNISSDEFEKAYECYLLDEENMAWVMDEVLSSLSIIQSKLDEKKEEQE